MNHRVVLASCLAATLAPAAWAAPQTPPVVGGLAHPGMDPRVRGSVLLGELGCASCHDPGARAPWISTRVAPRLADVAGRVHPGYLMAFIADPHGQKPGTTMPDMMVGWSPEQRGDAAQALTHYLLSLSEARFAPGPPDPVAARRGRTLFHEVGCVACHAPRSAEGEEIAIEGSVPLGRLERKYGPSSLMQFLEAPHRVRPSGRMPHFKLAPQEAYDLAHYLLQRQAVPGRLRFVSYVGSMEEGLDGLAGKEQKGGLVADFSLRRWQDERGPLAVVFDGFLPVPRAGRYTFELSCDTAGRLSVGGQRLIDLDVRAGGGAAGRGRGTVELAAGLHAISLAYLHTRGERQLALHWSGPGLPRQPVGAASLQSVRDPVAPFEPQAWRVDRAKAATGAALFAELRCVQCHDDASPTAAGGLQTSPSTPRPAAAALAELNPGQGCLSGAAPTGARTTWPSYRLDPAQRRDLGAALADRAFAPDAEQRIRKSLAAFNCLACHTRGALGGVSPSRNDYFTTDAVSLGEAGRVPPPLARVGAKLQPGWLFDTLAYGQSVRPYLETRMPGFGKDNVAELAALFGEVDRLPPVRFEDLPKDNKKADAIRKIGRDLVGDRGMNCITCHTFRGRVSPVMAAVDLVETTKERLQRTWFHHYMLDPPGFRPGTLMPRFFHDGASAWTDLAGGDAKRQLEAMWHYLAEGRNTREPPGLVRPKMEIEVGGEAVMLRRKVQNTGKRGISVGYPLGVNLTFDAESLGLNQIWWGRFIDPAGVWTGQGSGAARILGADRATLPKGPAFVELASETEAWPTATRRELGHRFKGYDLGEQRRPVFRYVCQDVSIADAPEDVADPGGGRPLLRRTFQLTANAGVAATAGATSGDDKVLYFRAAVDPQIEDLGSQGVQVGRSLVLRLQPGTFRIRENDKAKELVVVVRLRGGKAQFAIDYSWKEKPR